MHNIERLPGAKVITGLLWIILLAGLLAWLAPRFMPSLADLTPEPEVKQQATLSVLRSETLAFLVTRRNVMQVVVEHGETSWSGQWRGVLWSVGVSLSHISFMLTFSHKTRSPSRCLGSVTECLSSPTLSCPVCNVSTGRLTNPAASSCLALSPAPRIALPVWCPGLSAARRFAVNRLCPALPPRFVLPVWRRRMPFHPNLYNGLASHLRNAARQQKEQSDDEAPDQITAPDAETARHAPTD